MNEQQRSNDGQPLTYIMSPSYSGSTLLTFLLANHPEIATIGELKASAIGDVNAYTCSCGDHFTSCEFWQQMVVAMRRRGREFSLDQFGTHFRTRSAVVDRLLRATVRGAVFEHARTLATCLMPSCRSVRDDIIEQNRVFIEETKRIQAASHFLDGSKDPIRLKHFHDSGRWNIKVIRLVRDGRGVANSYMKHVGVSMGVAAEEWALKCREMSHVMARLPKGRVLTVHYEDLCRNTPEVLENILTFMGLDASDFPSDYDHAKHHILGNSMRLRSSGEVRLDEKWRRMLSDDDLRQFDSIGGRVNRELGYR